MYNFILNMWTMKRIDAEKVNSYVPKWIDEQQALDILATTQV